MQVLDRQNLQRHLIEVDVDDVIALLLSEQISTVRPKHVHASDLWNERIHDPLSRRSRSLRRKEQKRTQVLDGTERCLDTTDSRKEVF